MNLLLHRAPARADHVAFVGNAAEVRQRTEEVPWSVQRVRVSMESSIAASCFRNVRLHAFSWPESLRRKSIVFRAHANPL
jgi:hypothetical protein